MSWFLNQTVNGILQLVIALIVQITNQLVLCLGFSPNAIKLYFSGIDTFSQAFKIIGLFLLIVIVLWQLMKNIFGELSYGDKDNPVILLLRSSVAILMILWSMSFMAYFFNVFSQPFYILNDDSGEELAFNIVNDDNSIFKDTISTAFGNFIEAAENTNEEDYNSAIEHIKEWIFPGISILKSLVELICIAILGFKFIFFLLTILERYFLLMLQTYLSPLIWPTIVSKSTNGIFKKWFEILVSNFILVYLNMWMLGLIVKSMAFLFNPNTKFTDETLKPNFILGVACFYVMLRIAQSLSNYLNRILTTFGSGASFGTEIFMTFRTIQQATKALTRAGSKAAKATKQDSSNPSNNISDSNEFYQSSNGGDSYEENQVSDKQEPSNEVEEPLNDNTENFEQDGNSQDVAHSENNSKSQLIENNKQTGGINTAAVEGNDNQGNLEDDNWIQAESIPEFKDWEELNNVFESNHLLDDKDNKASLALDTMSYSSFIDNTGLDNLSIISTLGEDMLPTEVTANNNGEYRISGINNDTGNYEELATLIPSERLSSIENLENDYSVLTAPDGEQYALIPENQKENVLEALEQNNMINSIESSNTDSILTEDNNLDNIADKTFLDEPLLLENSQNLLSSERSPLELEDSQEHELIEATPLNFEQENSDSSYNTATIDDKKLNKAEVTRQIEDTNPANNILNNIDLEDNEFYDTANFLEKQDNTDAEKHTERNKLGKTEESLLEEEKETLEEPKTGLTIRERQNLLFKKD